MVKDEFQSGTFSPLMWAVVSVIAPLTLFTGYLVLANHVHSVASSVRFLVGMLLCAAVGCWPIIRTPFSITARFVLCTAYIVIATMIFFAYALAFACRVFHDCFLG
jgi:hypothetical protein